MTLSTDPKIRDLQILALRIRLLNAEIRRGIARAIVLTDPHRHARKDVTASW